MKDPKEKKFLQTKEQVIENLQKLRLAVDQFTDEGMPDASATVYNHVVDLLDQVAATEMIEELPAIVINAENIEKQVDIWLSAQGQDTLELQWPVLT